jgi:ADP-heptose:LPS heptosyltransferase
MSESKANKILLVRHQAFGDVLMASPFVRVLHARHPDAQIDLYSSVQGSQDGIAGFGKTIGPRDAPPERIMQLPYDCVYWLSYEHAPDLHILDGYQQSSGIAIDDRTLEWHVTAEEATRAQARLADLPRPLVGLSPLCGHTLRNLDEALIQPLIDAVQARFGGTVLLCYDKPVDFARCVNLSGTVANTRELAAIIGQCDGWIAIDSGPFHLAQALDVPVVGLFGSTLPELRITRPESAQLVRNENLDCLGCYHRLSQGKRYPCKCQRGDHACMRQLDPAAIVAALANAMAHQPDARLAQRLANYANRNAKRLTTFSGSAKARAVRGYRKLVCSHGKTPGFFRRLERSLRHKWKARRNATTGNP